MDRGLEMRLLVVALPLCLAASLSACSFTSQMGKESATPEANSQSESPAVSRSPLQTMEKLEELGVFGDCGIGDVRVDWPGNPTEVYCYVLRIQQIEPRSSADKRSVSVWVWKDGEYSQSQLCEAFRWLDDDRYVVSDRRTFLAIGNSGLTDGTGFWPKEVWPEDIQRVLGGDTFTYPLFCDSDAW